MTFWIIVGLLAALVAALLALALIRRRTDTEPAAAFDLRVYRDQLKEVDRDLARGLVSQADADRVRTEISRRILAADAEVQRAADGTASRTPGVLVLAGGLAAVLIGGSVALYSRIGQPGYGDLPRTLRVETAAQVRAERPSQDAAESRMPADTSAEPANPDYLALVQKLRDTVAARPDDLQGNVLLARNEAILGRFKAAYEAQANVLRIKGDAATAGDFADYADMMVLAAGGYVSPEAEAALTQALKLDARNGAARYYWGLMQGQTGRPDVAFRVWAQLLNDSTPDAPWVPPVRAQIEDMAALAGESRFTLPPLPGSAAPGPDADDVAAASEMSEEDRQQMIRGMVDRLSDRLASEGGTPQEWARLISALGVLGDSDRAQAIWDEAKQVFAGNDAALAPIRDAATQSGLRP